MAEDKYAPTATDSVKEVHAKHLWLVRDQQNANKKLRDAKKHHPVAGDATKGNPDAPPTQPPQAETPANPAAPQLQPESNPV
jgi:hypothetical protein